MLLRPSINTLVQSHGARALPVAAISIRQCMLRLAAGPRECAKSITERSVLFGAWTGVAVLVLLLLLLLLLFLLLGLRQDFQEL